MRHFLLVSVVLLLTAAAVGLAYVNGLHRGHELALHAFDTAEYHRTLVLEFRRTTASALDAAENALRIVAAHDRALHDRIIEEVPFFRAQGFVDWLAEVDG